MSFLEWRKFTFFDCHAGVDNGKLAECLQDTNVKATTSGNNQVVVCDVTGWAHIISRSWEITSFKAYELTCTLAQQLPNHPYLVTVGYDEPGTNPVIKVWDWSRVTRHGNPTCTRTSRAAPPHGNAAPATALAVHDNKNLMAVGFADGSVSLYRGDISRQRSAMPSDAGSSGTGPITGLAFKGADKLFVVSRSRVRVHWVGTERCVTLESSMGAERDCLVMDGKQQLLVTNENAIYCYTTEGLGPCYPLKGKKVRLDWFRTYLVITTDETPESSTSNTKLHNLTILDIQNKFIVYSKTFDEIDAVFTEWGSIHILKKNKEVVYLEEKDLQSKLSLLFKKNIYDVAIRMASSHHYDVEGLTEICKQYGDHLYSKGDFKGAIEQYVKTIGWLETSYVIQKYLESRHLEPLVIYLEELHKKGYATEDHTTLLLTCYVKLDQHDQNGKLKDFINSKDQIINFDVDIAIKVVRQVSVDDALSLASNHKRHDWFLKISIEDKKDYLGALDYIVELDFEDADFYMKKYGHALIQHEPEASTEFLKLLCTDYKPRSQLLVDEASLSGLPREPKRAFAEDYIHMYLRAARPLAALLQHVFANAPHSARVCNALIEHTVLIWTQSEGEEKAEFEERALRILKDPEANYDKDQTLIICQMLNFEPGILYLYEENKLWRAQVSLHTRGAQWSRALAACRRRGAACPQLWLDVLYAAPPAGYLPELLSVVASEKLLSPILVIDSLANTPSYTLGDVRKYLTDVLKSEAEDISQARSLCDKYRGSREAAREACTRLAARPATFQASRCAACNRPLELPTAHFLCLHSFHLHCFRSYSECESECPACAPTRVRPDVTPRADTLHARLTAGHEPYTVIAEYFGRGLFNKITVVTESESDPSPVVTAPAPTVPAVPTIPAVHALPTSIPTANAASLFTPTPKTSTIIPVPEGRMRMIEKQRYSSSLDANMTKIKPTAKTLSLAARKEDLAISSAISNSKKANYDESKNPFASDEEDDPTNPFNGDDDYDSNLNPFS